MALLKSLHTVLGVHLFYFTDRRIEFISYVYASHVVHIVSAVGRRHRGPWSLFANRSFVPFRTQKCRLLVGIQRIHNSNRMMRVVFGAGRGGQFDKMLTRDAPNVCRFLNPLNEGYLQEPYICFGEPSQQEILRFCKVSRYNRRWYFVATEHFYQENKQNGGDFAAPWNDLVKVGTCHIAPSFEQFLKYTNLREI